MTELIDAMDGRRYAYRGGRDRGINLLVEHINALPFPGHAICINEEEQTWSPKDYGHRFNFTMKPLSMHVAFIFRKWGSNYGVTLS